MTRRHVERGLSLLVIALGASAFYWLHMRSGIEWKTESVRDFIAGFGALGPFAFIALMALRPFLWLPSWLILFACGMVFGPWLGALYGAVGGLIGGALIFGIARAFGRDAVQSRIGGALRLIDEMLTNRGVPWLAVYTAVPISPLTPMFAGAGVSRMGIASFSLAIGLGFLPRASVFSFAGQAATEPSLLNLGIAGAVGLAAIVGTWSVRGLFRPS